MLCRIFPKRCNNTQTKVKEYLNTQVARSIERKIFQSCSPALRRPDTGFLKFIELVRDPRLSKPIPLHSEGKTYHVFVRKDFVLSKEERKTVGRIPAFSNRKFESTMSSILINRIKNNVSLDTLVIRGAHGWDCHLTINLPYLLHGVGCALAVYHGLLTFLGENPRHSAVAFRKGKILTVSSSRNYPILSLTAHFLRVFPKKKTEVQLVKLIKLSFCGSFSLKANQELPENFETDSFKIMPPSMEDYSESKCQDQNDLVRLYFSLQQAKGLCQAVPETFLNDGLRKHRTGLVRDQADLIPKDEELYNKLREFASQKLGPFVERHYDPYNSSIPNQKSCYENSRQRGGALQAIADKKSILVGEDPLTFDGKDRSEPFVIGLFGPPASGKSTILRELIHRISRTLFQNLEEGDLYYSRSCASKHWDGYKNQPIAVLDDWGQDIQNASDIQEFAQLVSTNPYILPMAELSEKGTFFTSPIIIVTSNVRFGSKFLYNNSYTVVDPLAIWRRFHYPLQVAKDPDGKKMTARIIPDSYACPIQGPSSNSSYNPAHRENVYSVAGGWVPLPIGKTKDGLSNQSEVGFQLDRTPLGISHISEAVCREVLSRLRHHQMYLTGSWTQEIGSVQFRRSYREEEICVDLHECQSGLTPGLHTYLKFPLSPPDGLPPVKAVALAEPLKVRIITAGECDLKVLQPLQRAMWQGLSHYPQFSLTHGIKNLELEDIEERDEPAIFTKMEAEINRIYRNRNDGTWLSGDYTAATDNLPMWVTEALMEGILDHVDHEPTKEWARYEVGPHSIEYPKSSGVPNGTQNSGQLMGSLLSFPLLCLANSFIAEYSGMKETDYLVNGDDLVAHTSLDSISNWKKNAPRIGLSLSLGKNFVSESFCTVNSQLFTLNDKDDSMQIRHTGKVSLLRREGGPIGDTYADFQRFYGIEDIFRNVYISNNFHKLKETPASLQVPKSHGGLGSRFVHSGKVNQLLAKQVWLAELDKIVSPACDRDFEKFTGLVPVRAPYISVDDQDDIPDPESAVIDRIRSLSLAKVSEDDDFENHPELTTRELREFRKSKLEGPVYKTFKDILANSRIRICSLPSLKMVKTQIFFIERKHYRKVQDRLTQTFLEHLATSIRSGHDINTWYNADLDLSFLIEAKNEFGSKSDNVSEHRTEDSVPTVEETLHSLFDFALHDLDKEMHEGDEILDIEKVLSQDERMNPLGDGLWEDKRMENQSSSFQATDHLSAHWF